jgi:hypothetical protein
MKKLSFVSLSVFLILFVWSCNEQTKITEPELEFTEVAIPSHLKSNMKASTETVIVEKDVKLTTEEGKEIVGKMRFEIPVGDEETLVNFEMTANLFQGTGLTTDFFVNYDENSNLKGTMGIGSCLKACNGIEKGEGRGWCKAGCWGELALKAAAVVVAIAAL